MLQINLCCIEVGRMDFMGRALMCMDQMVIVQEACFGKNNK